MRLLLSYILSVDELIIKFKCFFKLSPVLIYFNKKVVVKCGILMPSIRHLITLDICERKFKHQNTQGYYC
jgi:hypothetical protein